MRLGRDLQMSINLLAKLSNSPRSTTELAAELGTSYDNVQRLASRLRKRGLCSGIRGWNGGWVKARDVKLADLISLNPHNDPINGKAADIQQQLESALNSIWI